MAYDNIKSHKKPRLHPLSRRYSFEKTTERIKLAPASLLRVKMMLLLVLVLSVKNDFTVFHNRLLAVTSLIMKLLK